MVINQTGCVVCIILRRRVATQRKNFARYNRRKLCRLTIKEI